MTETATAFVERLEYRLPLGIAGQDRERALHFLRIGALVEDGLLDAAVLGRIALAVRGKVTTRAVLAALKEGAKT